MRSGFALLDAAQDRAMDAWMNTQDERARLDAAAIAGELCAPGITNLADISAILEATR